MAVKQKHGYQPKPRNTGHRERKSVILLASEGKNKTETLYFRGIDSDKYVIRFTRGNYTDPVNMVNELKNEVEELGLDDSLGDKAFCLVDSDTDSSKDSAIEKADRLAGDIAKVIVSNPCFEIWFLCHFTASTREYATSAEVITALRKYIPDYQKNTQGIYARLRDKKSVAIRNAKSLEKHCLSIGKTPHTIAFCPSTEVYRIIEQII